MLRAFDATSADKTSSSDGYLNPQSVLMGMDVFRPPSVFSYFSPGTVVAGTTGVRGPEFGIFSTSTALRRLNFVNTMVFSGIAVSANAPSGTVARLVGAAGAGVRSGPARGFAERADAARLDVRRRCARSSSDAVAAVPASNPLKRARTAVYLVATSSQYQVQR